MIASNRVESAEHTLLWYPIFRLGPSKPLQQDRDISIAEFGGLTSVDKTPHNGANQFRCLLTI
ncbi:hypothetical protein [Sulfuriferula plumbiphila]|uniref:hypothetical protein n=1 Tax=Sulfuriferula plumbiphila TaxID=171865 RepID=UPI0011BF0271|nr:hypothetical protein [Sulfuriferula plumbiphila]